MARETSTDPSVTGSTVTGPSLAGPSAPARSIAGASTTGPSPAGPPAAGSTTGARIVAAALNAFAGRGVEATSLDSVAEDVGVRKQTLLYWFPSKEALLFAVIDHAVADLGARLAGAARGEVGDRPGSPVVAVVDATFRLGRTDPALLALVREVARLGPPASTHLAAALEPLADHAARSMAPNAVERAAARSAIVDAGLRMIGIATEAELRTQLGLAPDMAWLRSRRRALLADLRDRLGA